MYLSTCGTDIMNTFLYVFITNQVLANLTSKFFFNQLNFFCVFERDLEKNKKYEFDQNICK